jgi:UDPglucose 6-dehydrogenase
MRLAILGLWHLGQVVAAGSAAAGHLVSGWDPSEQVVNDLNNSLPTINEPGLVGQIKAGIANGNLAFNFDLPKVLSEAEIVWVTFDTPVNENDEADYESVISLVKKAMPLAEHGAVILVSSQLPAGSIRELEKYANQICRHDLELAYSPENLRLGQALEIFSSPDRVICGIRNERAKQILTQLWSPITTKIEWMRVESAEMTKHAINAFLAISACFANELASICEGIGADAKEVERGLKTEIRIGPKAYVGPGLAFSGGTLARDLSYLAAFHKKYQNPGYLVKAAQLSNNHHKNWVVDNLLVKFSGNLQGKQITLWGLTYKPGTDTLRRSAALEIADKLLQLGCLVKVHDPGISSLPEPWNNKLSFSDSALNAAKGSNALIISTAWPEYLEEDIFDVIDNLSRPLIIDPSGFLRKKFSDFRRLEYVSIGFIPEATEQAR